MYEIWQSLRFEQLLRSVLLGIKLG